MPRVGKDKAAKHFPYTEKGKSAARRHAKRTGKKVVNVRKSKR